MSVFQAKIMKYILQKSESVKFVIVLNRSAFDSVRGETVKTTLNYLKGTFGMDFLNEHKNSFMVAITCLQDNKDFDGILHKKDVMEERDLNEFFNDLIKLPVNYK